MRGDADGVDAMTAHHAPTPLPSRQWRDLEREARESARVIAEGAAKVQRAAEQYARWAAEAEAKERGTRRVTTGRRGKVGRA